MSNANRKIRRAMDAQARKNLNKVKNNPDLSVEALVMQRKYDQKVVEVMQLQSALLQQQALTAGVMIEFDQSEVTVGATTIEAIRNGVIAGFDRRVEEDGSVTLTLVFHEEGDEDDSDPVDGVDPRLDEEAE